MRVINLKLEAFGPFKEEVNIDFEKFGEQGIYLISGSTGAGKTSIFDAISFALFGGSSGGYRDERMLRYIGATPDIKTFVELVFEYKNKMYKIKRVPKYMRYKRAGEGLTDINTKESEITLPSGEVINGLKEVDDYINNLLGIDENQFRQIVMLAQGNFMALLKASSNDKVELFRKIFSTHKYQRLEIDIFNKLKQTEKILINLRERYEEILSNIKIMPEKIEEFEEVKVQEIREVIEYIKNINLKYEEFKLNKNIHIENNSKSLDDLKSKRDKVEEYNELKKQILEITNVFNETKKEYINIKKEFDTLENKEKDLEKNKSNLVKFENELQKFKKLDKIISDKKLINEKLKETKINSEKLNSKLENKKEEFNNINEYLEKNKDANLILNKLETEILSYESNISSIKDSLEVVNEKKKIELVKKDLVLKHKNIKKEQLENSEKYNSILTLYFESQAGILAKDLQVGEECPVCGAREHPKLAILNDNIPTDIEVKTYKDKLEKSSDKFEKLNNEISEINGKLISLETNIDKIKQQYNTNEEIEEYLKKHLSEIKEIISIKISKKNEIYDILNQINIKEVQLKEINNDLININNNINEYSKEEIKLNENMKLLYKQETEELKILGDKSKEEIENNKFNTEKTIKDIEEFIKNTRKKYEEINKNYILLNNKKELLEERIDDKYNLDLNNINESILELENKLKKLREEYSELKSNLDINIFQLNKMDNIKIDMEKYSIEYGHYNDLNNILKGKIKGLKNIRFETFVQIKYFDEILYYANNRFHEMTEGKYSLQRKKEANNLNEQTGLDFEVVDHHNKTTRNINTLSGGESFQAALSLALGLSDVVQMHAGGIQLDSMFIDEGFGTLDRSTLSKVMSSLLDISQFNKLIGIISHVEVLKEQIDKQIIVEKTNRGYSEITNQIY